MAESAPPNPNHMVPPLTPAEQPPPLLQAQPPPASTISFPRPPIRVTTEFDSESSVFFQKISCKFFDSLAKLKLSFQNNKNGEILAPRFTFISKHLAVDHDVEMKNTLIKGSFDVGPKLHFRGSHYVQAQQGEVAMVADLADPGYKLELSSAVPRVGLPKATFKFPLGEVTLEETEPEEEAVKRSLSINGIVQAKLMRGVCSALYDDENLQLRYTYKDEEMSFIPSISLPSNALSFAFKRRFGPSDKLSYWYEFDSNYWSAVYKHTYGKDYKFKTGYDSNARLGWASLWVGDENGKAKTALMKLKVQFMLQVPQDDLRDSRLMLRVKKRWDI